MNAISHTLFLRDLNRFHAEQSLSRFSAVKEIWFECLAFYFSGNFPWDLSGHTSIYTQLRFPILLIGSIYLTGVFNVRCWLCLNVASYSLISLETIYFPLNDCDLHTIYFLNHSLDGPNANQTVLVTPQKEISNPTTFYPLRLGSHISAKPSEFLNSRYHIWDFGPILCTR